MSDHAPGPIETEMIRLKFTNAGLAFGGNTEDVVSAERLLARELDAMKKRLDVHASLITCSMDFDTEAARREEEDIDGRLATVERAVRRLVDLSGLGLSGILRDDKE